MEVMSKRTNETITKATLNSAEMKTALGNYVLKESKESFIQDCKIDVSIHIDDAGDYYADVSILQDHSPKPANENDL